MNTSTNKFLISIFVICILFVGCEEDPVSPTNSDRVHGTIHGVVVDGNTNELLSGIFVKCLSGNSIITTTTDMNGYYIISDLQPGDYDVTFSDTTSISDSTLTYATNITQVTIEKLTTLVAGGNYEEDPGSGYFITVDQDIELLSLNAGITGNVYIEQDENNTIVAEAVVIIAEFDLNIYPNSYTTQTDQNGNYMFSNLPSAGTVSIQTLPYSIDGDNYASSTDVFNIISGASILVENIILFKTANEPILLSNNFLDIDFQINDDITGTYNESIDVDATTIIFSSSTGEYVISWNNDDKTFTIDPDEELMLNTQYSISVNGMTNLGKSFSDSFSLTTQPGIQILSTSFQQQDGELHEINDTDQIQIIFSESLDGTRKFDMGGSEDQNVVISGMSNDDFDYIPSGNTLNIVKNNGWSAGTMMVVTIKVASQLSQYDIFESTFNINVLDD